MENILNMEYSLMGILYLVELQIKEGQQSDFIRLKKTYPFCDGVEYKKEALEYLVKYDNDKLNRILNNHKQLCDKIIEKWDNELRIMVGDIINEDVLSYNIYCTPIKNGSFPFECLNLIRKNKTIYERGNRFVEDYRYWKKFDFGELHEKYFEYHKDHPVFSGGWDLKEDVINTPIFLLIDFVVGVRKFLSDYVHDIGNLTVKTSQPQETQPEASEQAESDTNEVNAGKPKQYIFDISKITAVYSFCVKTKVLDGSAISNVDFINAVNEANFKTIHAHAEQQRSKSKCKYIIFLLSKFIVGGSWYLNTAHSINTEPNKCSGIGVPVRWKKEADTIK
jgi:hypothetical protein